MANFRTLGESNVFLSLGELALRLRIDISKEMKDEVMRHFGLSPQIYYRWKSGYIPADKQVELDSILEKYYKKLKFR